MAKPTGSFRDEDEVVDRNRILRERARWRGLEEATRLATIQVLEHGGVSRPIITRGGKHLRSRLVSAKTRRVQVTEGKGLRFLCRRCEVDGAVLDYQAHPFRVTAVADGGAIEWYPDIVYILADGGIELVEVKRTPRDLQKEGLEEKLAAFREIFRRCGWRVRILYDADIYGAKEVRGVRARTVGATYARRFLALDESETAAIAALVRAGQATEWAHAAERLSPKDRLRGDALVEHAISRGHFAVDFDEPFGAFTLITPMAQPVAGAVGTIRI